MYHVQQDIGVIILVSEDGQVFVEHWFEQFQFFVSLLKKRNKTT